MKTEENIEDVMERIEQKGIPSKYSPSQRPALQYILSVKDEDLIEDVMGRIEKKGNPLEYSPIAESVATAIISLAKAIIYTAVFLLDFYLEITEWIEKKGQKQIKPQQYSPGSRSVWQYILPASIVASFGAAAILFYSFYLWRENSSATMPEPTYHPNSTAVQMLEVPPTAISTLESIVETPTQIVNVNEAIVEIPTQIVNVNNISYNISSDNIASPIEETIRLLGPNGDLRDTIDLSNYNISIRFVKFSPDKDKIIFADNSQLISVLDLKTGVVSEICGKKERTNICVVAENPVWSPDGESIAFKASREIMEYNLNTSEFNVLYQNKDYTQGGSAYIAQLFQWSPRSSLLVDAREYESQDSYVLSASIGNLKTSGEYSPKMIYEKTETGFHTDILSADISNNGRIVFSTDTYVKAQTQDGFKTIFDSPVRCLALSNDGKRLGAVKYEDDTHLILYDMINGRTISTITLYYEDDWTKACPDM